MTHAMMTIAKLKVAAVKGYSRGEYVAYKALSAHTCRTHGVAATILTTRRNRLNRNPTV